MLDLKIELEVERLIRKQIGESQLPRPIKGTGLAKDLNPLYLSEVCNSCTWS